MFLKVSFRSLSRKKIQVIQVIQAIQVIQVVQVVQVSFRSLSRKNGIDA